MFNPNIFYLPVMPAQIYGQHILPESRFTFIKNVNFCNSLLWPWPPFYEIAKVDNPYPICNYIQHSYYTQHSYYKIPAFHLYEVQPKSYSCNSLSTTEENSEVPLIKNLFYPCFYVNPNKKSNF